MGAERVPDVGATRRALPPFRKMPTSAEPPGPAGGVHSEPLFPRDAGTPSRGSLPGSDVVSAVTGAVGALKGPLHGGAAGPASEHPGRGRGISL